jgi:hypothetical protein
MWSQHFSLNSAAFQIFQFYVVVVVIMNSYVVALNDFQRKPSFIYSIGQWFL